MVTKCTILLSRDMMISSGTTSRIDAMIFSSFRYNAAFGTIDVFVTNGHSMTLSSGRKTRSMLKSSDFTGGWAGPPAKGSAAGSLEHNPHMSLNSQEVLWWQGHWEITATLLVQEPESERFRRYWNMPSRSKWLERPGTSASSDNASTVQSRLEPDSNARSGWQNVTSRRRVRRKSCTSLSSRFSP